MVVGKRRHTSIRAVWLQAMRMDGPRGKSAYRRAERDCSDMTQKYQQRYFNWLSSLTRSMVAVKKSSLR